MKNFLIGLTALFSLAIVSIAFAIAPATSNYYLNSNDPSITKTLTVPATNITVLNYSDESIYIALPLNFEIFSGNSRTISRDSYYGYTQLVLQDWNRIDFFNQNICRRAIVTIDGRPGFYHVSIDNKFC